METISYDTVKELFSYKDGDLIWRKPLRRGWKGKVAGWISDRGYKMITINGKNFRAHRLAWLWNYGYLPENGLDHIDGNKSSTDIQNLREVSQSCNMRNCGNPSNNVTGVKGVRFAKRDKLYIASIAINMSEHHIGCSKNFDDMVLLRYAAEQCLDWSNCDANSPAKQYCLKHGLIKK